jgi:hypothetical protein
MARHNDTHINITTIRSKLEQVQAFVRPSEFRTEAERVEDINIGREHMMTLQRMMLEWFEQQAAKPTKMPRD